MATRRFALIKQVTSLDDLSGVDTSGATSGDALVWNGTEWVPGDHGDLGGLSDNDHPQYLLAASYTAADVLAKLLTVDGSGSGLDADLLDGLSSADFASATRNLTAGAGLTGGGTLAADRTFDVGAGTGITVNAADVALNTAHVRNVDHSGVTLTAGTGLTGGGDISANRTFDVGAGDGIIVNADNVQFDNEFVGPYWAGSGTVTNPTYSFLADVSTGIYLEGAGILSMACAGEIICRYRNEVSLKGVQLVGSVQFGSHISPAQITANQNDYNPTGLTAASVLRLSSDASRNITGLVTALLTSRTMLITNVGTQDIVLVNQSASSTADYRFEIGANITIGANEGVILLYDTTSRRWRCVGKHV